jgi:hypothetical protein
VQQSLIAEFSRILEEDGCSTVDFLLECEYEKADLLRLGIRRECADTLLQVPA